jgi:hypothetical protein
VIAIENVCGCSRRSSSARERADSIARATDDYLGGCPIISRSVFDLEVRAIDKFSLQMRPFRIIKTGRHLSATISPTVPQKAPDVLTNFEDIDEHDWYTPFATVLVKAAHTQGSLCYAPCCDASLPPPLHCSKSGWRTAFQNG